MEKKKIEKISMEKLRPFLKKKELVVILGGSGGSGSCTNPIPKCGCCKLQGCYISASDNAG